MENKRSTSKIYKERFNVNGNNDSPCECCTESSFTKGELELYEMAKTKGRRGIVVSLDLDQSTSCLLSPKSKQKLITFRVATWKST